MTEPKQRTSRLAPSWWCLLILGTLGALLAAGCGASTVQNAEARWQASGVTDYRIRVQEVRSIWCVYRIELKVRGGQIASATVTASPGPAQGCWDYTDGVIDKPIDLSPQDAERWTVPGLFELARQLEPLARQKDMEIQFEFDSDLGYPLRMARDDVQSLDDDTLLTTLYFERLD